MTDSQAARMKLLFHKVGASPALAGKKHCPQCVKCFFFSPSCRRQARRQVTRMQTYHRNTGTSHPG